jgi:tetratricopeptide (TPR) repeat protein
MRYARISALALTAALLVPQALADPATPDPSVQPDPDARKAALDFWLSIKNSTKAEDYQAYLDKYPNGDFAELARFRLQKYAAPASPPAASTAGEDPRLVEIDRWNAIKNTHNIQDYYAYLDDYPNGEFAELAKMRIEQMTAAAAPAPTLLLAPPAPPAEPAAKAEPAPAPAEPPAAENPPPPEAAPAEKATSAEPAAPPLPQAKAPETPQAAQPVNAAPPPTPAAEPASAKPPPIEFSTVYAKLYAKGGGQVRVEPSSKTALLAKLKTNTEVLATGRSTDRDWWRVQILDGKTGYMHKSVVSEQPVPAAPAAAAPAKPDAELCEPASQAAPNTRVAACERILTAAGSDEKATLAALIDLATALNIAGRNDEAIRKYEQASELAPSNGKIYYRLGMVRLDQQKYPEARAAFEEAAQFDPDNPDIVVHRSIAYVGIGDFEQAKLDVKRALLAKEDPAYYERLDQIALAQGDLEEAKTALERGRKADPTRKSLILLATNYFIGARDQALGQGAVVPDDSNAALWNAILRKAGGDGEGAEQILKSARIEIGKKDWPGPIFDALLGRLSVAKARIAAGPKQFQRLCKLNFFIGEWAYLSGDKAAARAALQAAVDTRAYTMLEFAAAKARLANMGG